jgi:hypothetical protein
MDTQGGRTEAAFSIAPKTASLPSVFEQYVTNHNTRDKYLNSVKKNKKQKTKKKKPIKKT